MSRFVQPLESRRLLSSASGVLAAVTVDPTIQQDRADLHAALDTYRSDRRDGRATIRDDQQAIRDETKKLVDDKGAQAVQDALQPLKDKIRADEKAKSKELRGVAHDLSTLKRTWAKSILADLQAWRQARRSGDQSAIDDAKSNLDADKKAASDALAPIRDKIIAAKDKWRPIITAEHDAIIAKLEELDPALKPLYDKLASDSKDLATKLTDDAKAIADATKKLTDDILAARNTAST